MMFTTEQVELVLRSFKDGGNETDEQVGQLAQSPMFMKILLGLSLKDNTDPAVVAANLSLGIAIGYRLALESLSKAAA